MYDFKKLKQVLSIQKDRQKGISLDNAANNAYLCLADSTQKAVKCGFNSVSLEEIELLIESTWELITMEEDCEEESVNNYYTPFGERILNEEIIQMLLSAKNEKSKERIF